MDILGGGSGPFWMVRFIHQVYSFSVNDIQIYWKTKCLLYSWRHCIYYICQKTKATCYLYLQWMHAQSSISVSKNSILSSFVVSWWKYVTRLMDIRWSKTFQFVSHRCLYSISHHRYEGQLFKVCFKHIGRGWFGLLLVWLISQWCWRQIYSKCSMSP